MSDSDLAMAVRDSAALVGVTMADSRPNYLGRDSVMLAGIVKTIFSLTKASGGSVMWVTSKSNLAGKEEFEGQARNDPHGEGCITKMGMAHGTLDTPACDIPKNYVFEPVISQ